MKIGVDSTVSFNMGSVYKTPSQRSHDLAHSRRYTQNQMTGASETDSRGRIVQAQLRYYKHKNVDVRLSNLNYYVDKLYKGMTPYQILKRHFHDKCEIHDKKEMNRGHYKRLYGMYTQFYRTHTIKNHIGVVHYRKCEKSATDGYLQSNHRWLKPVRTLPLRFCDKQEKDSITKLFKQHNISLSKGSRAINMGYYLYAKNFNKVHQHMKITNLHTNLYDEAGGFHGHTDYLALGTTAKGQPSMSFNRAIKQDADTKLSRKTIASYFVNSQFRGLRKSMHKSFHDILGLDVDFVPLHHKHQGKYVRNLSDWQKQQDTIKNQQKTIENQRQLLNSADKQNSSYKAENKQLRSQNGRLRNQDNNLKQRVYNLKTNVGSLQFQLDMSKKNKDTEVDKLDSLAPSFKNETKHVNLLVKQNSQLKAKNQSLQSDYNQSQNELNNLKNQLESLHLSSQTLLNSVDTSENGVIKLLIRYGKGYIKSKLDTKNQK